MRWLPGGLLHTNIAGCTIFAAVSGSSAATLPTVGKMSIPELRQRGYPEYMIIGTLAGAATLGLMIPPSLTLIVYGVWHHAPFAFVVFYAGLQTVPQDTLESAMIDGNTRFQAFRKVTLPLALPDTVARLPKSNAFPVVAIVEKSIASVFGVPGMIPPIITPRV